MSMDDSKATGREFNILDGYIDILIAVRAPACISVYF
jgi:hypothetical protein